MEQIIESHPFEPWLPQKARILMLGTFPAAPSKWSMNFYYPNFINDMWRVFGYILHSQKDYYVDLENKTFRLNEIKEMLSELGIALSDTALKIIRLKNNASDKYLKIVESIDLTNILKQLPLCEAIATTGQKAAEVIAQITNTSVPKVGEYVTIKVEGYPHPLLHWRMPSTSRAHPMPVERKAEFYRSLFSAHKIL